MSSDRPRLLGRIGGATSLPAYAAQLRDEHGGEAERIDKDSEEEFARGSDELSAALRKRGKLEAEIPVKRQELRRALQRAQERGRAITPDALPASVRVHQRGIKVRRRRIEELSAKIGRLEWERRQAA